MLSSLLSIFQKRRVEISFADESKEHNRKENYYFPDYAKYIYQSSPDKSGDDDISLYL